MIIEGDVRFVTVFGMVGIIAMFSLFVWMVITSVSGAQSSAEDNFVANAVLDSSFIDKNCIVDANPILDKDNIQEIFVDNEMLYMDVQIEIYKMGTEELIYTSDVVEGRYSTTGTYAPEVVNLEPGKYPCDIKVYGISEGKVVTQFMSSKSLTLTVIE